MTRPHKPADFPTLSPYLTVVDAEASIQFYEEAFQFKLAHEPLKHENAIVHVNMYCYDASVMFSPENTHETEKKAPITNKISCPIGLYVYVPNVDDFFAHAQKNGAKVLSKPEDTFWGDRMCVLQDIDGYEWSFATNIADFNPQEQK